MLKQKQRQSKAASERPPLSLSTKAASFFPLASHAKLAGEKRPAAGRVKRSSRRHGRKGPAPAVCQCQPSACMHAAASLHRRRRRRRRPSRGSALYCMHCAMTRRWEEHGPRLREGTCMCCVCRARSTITMHVGLCLYTHACTHCVRPPKCRSNNGDGRGQVVYNLDKYYPLALFFRFLVK